LSRVFPVSEERRRREVPYTARSKAKHCTQCVASERGSSAVLTRSELGGWVGSFLLFRLLFLYFFVVGVVLHARNVIILKLLIILKLKRIRITIKLKLLWWNCGVFNNYSIPLPLSLRPQGFPEMRNERYFLELSSSGIPEGRLILQFRFLFLSLFSRSDLTAERDFLSL